MRKCLSLTLGRLDDAVAFDVYENAFPIVIPAMETGVYESGACIIMHYIP